MVPLDAVAAEHVRAWLGEPAGPGLLDLYQALADHRQGLWGDDPKVPRSVLLLREEGRQLEAFGAGDPEPAAGWLCRRGEKSVALMAPSDWWDVVEQRVEGVERVEVLTLSADASEFKPVSSAVVTRRLTANDSKAFLSPEVALEWALSSWGTFRNLVEHGAGYVVPFGSRFAATAWIYSQAGDYEAVGVSTVPRFQRLGLGKAVASALVSEIINTRGKVPLWTTALENEASVATAQSLGFSIAVTETYLRWNRPQGFIRTR
ncbi:GNAT family N-acetyltransferase [Singulisphaera acidiphila]|uniref:Putative acyltransferase n=1 Tax=Singulisphaera acidiphila (strain ATCC BAA-1392 / DSM 18658 / VKM B-2454 / MOB10) TaxID=886293 RepID=L0D5X7_SINAD|nr:GNAT family N-acetyltransferase [Singulisphaera acidiphila]AGA24662.1 putative acyltransferase [Singulisphaera acidiphila DSM 18658]